jgi:hypothetical protein
VQLRIYIPSKEGWIQVLAGQAPSSQTVGFYTEIPLTNKACQINLEKNEFGGFASMEKYTQLVLTQRIQQTQKFDKEGFF